MSQSQPRNQCIGQSKIGGSQLRRRPPIFIGQSVDSEVDWLIRNFLFWTCKSDFLYPPTTSTSQARTPAQEYCHKRKLMSQSQPRNPWIDQSKIGGRFLIGPWIPRLIGSSEIFSWSCKSDFLYPPTTSTSQVDVVGGYEIRSYNRPEK